LGKTVVMGTLNILDVKVNNASQIRQQVLCVINAECTRNYAWPI